MTNRDNHALRDQNNLHLTRSLRSLEPTEITEKTLTLRAIASHAMREGQQGKKA
jgi:hypothetical protein